MKKLFISLLFIAVAWGAPSAMAGLSENCFDVSCPADQDYYAGNCKPHIETLGNCTTPVLGAGQEYRFSCSQGCYAYTPPPAPDCPSGDQIKIGGVCKTIVKVVSDTLFKIWDGTALKRLVYVPDDDSCTNGQIVSWDSATSSWACINNSSGVWTQSGSDISYTAGKVGIGTSVSGFPAFPLHVNGTALIQGDFGVTGEPDFADNSIFGQDIRDYTITTNKIANDAITWRHLADLSVSGATLTDNSVNSSKIVDNTILSSDIWDGAVTADDIATNAVGASEIAANAVGSSEIAAGAVHSDEIADQTITSVDIGNDAVKTSELDYYFGSEAFSGEIGPGESDSATSFCYAIGDVVLSGECWGVNAAMTSISEFVDIIGFYRLSGNPAGFKCRGRNVASTTNKRIKARALCLTNN